MIAMVGSASLSLAQSAASQASLDLRTTSDTLGANARQAMIDIFRKKDATVVDRYFGESFVQHDPNLADGLAGMKSFAADVASSPTADITIYRTLVDGDFVLLHSRYDGVGRLRLLLETLDADRDRFRDLKDIYAIEKRSDEVRIDLERERHQADRICRIRFDLCHSGRVGTVWLSKTARVLFSGSDALFRMRWSADLTTNTSESELLAHTGMPASRRGKLSTVKIPKFQQLGSREGSFTTSLTLRAGSDSELRANLRAIEEDLEAGCIRSRHDQIDESAVFRGDRPAW